MTFLRTALLGACALPLFILPSVPVSAEDGLIWAPAKVGRNAYDLRVGAAVPVAWELRGGARLNISANEAGRLNRPQRPLNLWGMLATPSARSGSVERRRDEMNVDFNTMSGHAYMQLKSTRTHMLTPGADIEILRAVTATANAYRPSNDVLEATAGARLVLRRTDTTFAANGAMRSNRDGAVGSFAIEQRLTPHLWLNAAISRTNGGANRSLRARYTISW